MNYTTNTSEIKLKADQSVDRHVLINQPKRGNEFKSILDMCLDTLPFNKSYVFKMAIGKRLDEFYKKPHDQYLREIQRIIVVLRDYNHGSISDSEFLDSIKKEDAPSPIVEFVSRELNGSLPAAFIAGLHAATISS